MTARVGLLGYYGRGNIGDEALLAGTLAGLRALGAEAQPVVYSYDPHATTQQHAVPARQTKTVNTLAIASRLSQVRGLVLGGGGILNDYRLSGLAFYAHWVAVARMLRRPVMLHAVGVGPLRTRSGRAMARWIASACLRVSVRDNKSLDLLKPRRALLAADPARRMHWWCCRAPASERTNPSRVPG